MLNNNVAAFTNSPIIFEDYIFPKGKIFYERLQRQRQPSVNSLSVPERLKNFILSQYPHIKESR